MSSPWKRLHAIAYTMANDPVRPEQRSSGNSSLPEDFNNTACNRGASSPARRGGSRAASIAFDAGPLDDVRPFGGLGLDERSELSRRGACHDEALRGEELLDIRLGQ